MKTNMKISGVGPLRKRFQDKRRNAKSVSVSVGYTANYAMAVHEMEPATPQWGRPRVGLDKDGKEAKGNYWDPISRGGPKFLEAPAREMQRELANIVEKGFSKGMTLMKALYVAGLRLQRESQERVPVNLGNLKGSAFTRKD